MQSQSIREASDPKSIEDVFASTVNLEEIHLEEGYKEGFNDGLVLGKQEGREVGLKLGFEVGEEIGFYRGCVDVWNSAIQLDPNRFTPHVQKNIKQIEELIKLYPILDPENERIQEIMDSLRAKFKAVSASMSSSSSSSLSSSMKLEYKGIPKSSGINDLEF